MAARTIAFQDLANADLIVDATYQGGTAGHAGDDPLSKLLGCCNQRGIRFLGTETSPKLVILYSTMSDPNWPDTLDMHTGLFIYYGDNKKPGHGLHDTGAGGNRILSLCFGFLHASPPARESVPPFLMFTKGEAGRDVVFRGLAVPGGIGFTATDDLVAVWQTVGNLRFQNYRAAFTILDVAQLPRQWIRDLQRGKKLTRNTPPAWRKWVQSGLYTPLQAPSAVQYRSKQQQMPKTKQQRELLACLYAYFKDDPYAFEACAAEVALLMDADITSYDLTRRWADGGRDVIGKYRIGSPGNEVLVEFALEAKCFQPEAGVGVRATSRLISRLRHRQFGILVTTSYVALQAYKEIVDDGHPVIVVSGGDMIRLLWSRGYTTKQDLMQWLTVCFPKP